LRVFRVLGFRVYAGMIFEGFRVLGFRVYAGMILRV
jgi:hypothetical protein